MTSYTVATAGPSSFKREVKGKNPFLPEKGFLPVTETWGKKPEKRGHFVLFGEISEVND